MSHPDDKKKHMVVRVEEIGELCMLCFTDSGQPAVYADPAFAELHAAQLRDRHPGFRFRCIAFEVL